MRWDLAFSVERPIYVKSLYSKKIDRSLNSFDTANCSRLAGLQIVITNVGRKGLILFYIKKSCCIKLNRTSWIYSTLVYLQFWTRAWRPRRQCPQRSTSRAALPIHTKRCQRNIRENCSVGPGLRFFIVNHLIDKPNLTLNSLRHI